MTAVEWLNSILDGQKDNPFDYDEWSIALEHAKEMEKEQMHAEYMRGWRDGLTKQGLPAPPLDRKIYK